MAASVIPHGYDSARMPASPRSAAAYLATRARLGVKFGLETIQALLDALGRPERAFPSLLVAGTNGKGSVVAYADAVLGAAGLCVGRYTSPHLVRVHERITVNGREITPRGLERAVGRVQRAAEELVAEGRLAAHPTYFEAVTAAAFAHFRSAGVEVAVLEVGMGGRLDATNACDPVASAIVSIALDHEAYLGASLDAIAGEKAGVLRASRTTVVGALPEEARTAIEREAAARGAHLVHAAEDTRVRDDPARPGSLSVETPRGRYDGLRPLSGLHQRDNLAVALRLLEEAHAAGIPFDPAAHPGVVAEGIAATRWPGRLQRLPGRPSLLLDGAHNPEGARALAAHLRTLGRPFVLVFGAMADKDITAMGRELFPLAEAIVLTQAPGDRAARASEIVERVGAAAAGAILTGGVREAMAAARRKAGPEGLVVVAGSLYLVGEVLKSSSRSRTKRTAPGSGRKRRT